MKQSQGEPASGTAGTFTGISSRIYYVLCSAMLFKDTMVWQDMEKHFGYLSLDIRFLPTSASPQVLGHGECQKQWRWRSLLFFESEGIASGSYPSYSVPKIWKPSIWVPMPYLNYEYFNPHAGPGAQISRSIIGLLLSRFSLSAERRPFSTSD